MAKKSRRQVDRDDRLPFIGRELLDRGDELDAGIVDENVDRAEGPFAERDHFRDLGGLAHVGRRIDRLDLEVGFDAGTLLLDVGRDAKSVDHNIRAGARERPHHCESDAAGGAGHNRGLTCQRTHLICSC